VNDHLFIVGAQRSGTTYLHSILNAHPDVFMVPSPKVEPKYFMESGSADVEYGDYWNKYFSHSANAKWLGEKSTSYLETEDAARNIKSMIPDAKILVILRDPVERAISNYFFSKGHGLETYDIETAIAHEQARVDAWAPEQVSVSPHAYTQRGKYIQHLQIWERLFGIDQMILLVSEYFLASQTAIASLYDKLDLDSTVIPTGTHERINAGPADRATAQIPDALRDRMKEIFKPWNQKLGDHFALDVSCWSGMS